MVIFGLGRRGTPEMLSMKIVATKTLSDTMDRSPFTANSAAGCHTYNIPNPTQREYTYVVCIQVHVRVRVDIIGHARNNM